MTSDRVRMNRMRIRKIKVSRPTKKMNKKVMAMRPDLAEASSSRTGTRLPTQLGSRHCTQGAP